jgi:hypothetical protein
MNPGTSRNVVLATSIDPVTKAKVTELAAVSGVRGPGSCDFSYRGASSMGRHGPSLLSARPAHVRPSVSG